MADRIRAGTMNAKYTHHTVQNALLDIMKDMILEQIKQNYMRLNISPYLQTNLKIPAKRNKLL